MVPGVPSFTNDTTSPLFTCKTIRITSIMQAHAKIRNKERGKKIARKIPNVEGKWQKNERNRVGPKIRT